MTCPHNTTTHPYARAHALWTEDADADKIAAVEAAVEAVPEAGAEEGLLDAAALHPPLAATKVAAAARLVTAGGTVVAIGEDTAVATEVGTEEVTEAASGEAIEAGSEEVTEEALVDAGVEGESIVRDESSHS